MPSASHASRIVVVDSTKPGGPLSHSMYAIVYTPSWLLLREKFNWQEMPRTLSYMKEYFITASFDERPFRAQRCLYSLKAISIYHPGRYAKDDRELYVAQYKKLEEYLREHPVIAWDWVVSWTESREIARAFPEDFIRLFRKFRSQKDTKRMPKPELTYFLELIQEVSKELGIDLERK